MYYSVIYLLGNSQLLMPRLGENWTVLKE
jgi:hypothetical protein